MFDLSIDRAITYEKPAIAYRGGRKIMSPKHAVDAISGRRIGVVKLKNLLDTRLRFDFAIAQHTLACRAVVIRSWTQK